MKRWRWIAGVVGLALGLLPAGAGAGATMAQKLKTLRLPDLEFRNATVSEVVDFIVTHSREADPEGTGVSIILKDNARGTVGSHRLTMSVAKPTVEHALKLLATTAELYVRVEASAVILEPSTNVVRDPPPAAPPR